MTINKNIMKIIVDKMALNKWKNKIKNINAEYYYIYEEFCDNLYININNECKCFGEFNDDIPFYQFREYDLDDVICHYTIVKCNVCNKIDVKTINDICVLSKNYFYTSGMNDPNGYK